nr:PREDICTED: C2 domain-containing protein 2 [Latimeria chalumnae]|eukprot:XP_014347198.1 PREDICTED: C2 domain-containing protein 2 [Latimeria chalumnae]
MTREIVSVASISDLVHPSNPVSSGSIRLRKVDPQGQQRPTPLLLTFEEAGSQPSELVVNRITSVVESDQKKVVCCNVIGDCVQFSVKMPQQTPTTTEHQLYDVKLSPLCLQLELHMKEVRDDIQVTWSLMSSPEWNLDIQPKTRKQVADSSAVPAILRHTLQSLLSLVQPSVVLSTKPGQGKDLQNLRSVGATTRMICPPKPPRAHELKLLVKNIKITGLAGQNAAGSICPVCSLHLDNPLQKFSTPAAKNTTNPTWDQQFIFELNARSKQLCLQVQGDEKASESGFLRKSAKLFFRRRHQQKDPGMSQSHNDLMYLQHPVPVEKERKGSTLTRILSKKLIPKSKSKLNGSMMD